jgi:hypothetical protein
MSTVDVLPNFQPPSATSFRSNRNYIPARSNCAHEDAVPNFVSGYAFSKLVDDPHGLMADD